MITMVEAITAQGETLSLPLQDASGGYIVKSIDGLDPVKATVVSSSFAQIDGTQYQTSRREERNLILKLGFQPDFVNTDVQTLRRQLYRYLMPKSFVTLRFYMDGVHFADIQGIVESHEAPRFAKEPTVNISVICFEPDFIAPDSVVLSGSTVADTTESLLVYPGSTEAGILFKLLVNRSIAGFDIDLRRAGAAFQNMEVAASLVSGDIVEISTIPGAKRALRTRAGVQTSILYAVSPASTWANIYPGDNMLRVSTGGAPIPYTIEYTARYGGL